MDVVGAATAYVVVAVSLALVAAYAVFDLRASRRDAPEAAEV